MRRLLEKLNYKGNKRIAVLNAEDKFISSLSLAISEVTIDREVDPRFPYDFILIFVRNQTEIDTFSSIALHNLLCDGVIWFCYPKKTSNKYNSAIDRDNGWKTVNDAGFQGVRMVAVDKDWSALRFRNIKFIRFASGKLTK